MTTIRELTDSLRSSRNPSSTRQKAISETLMERASTLSRARDSTTPSSEEKYVSDDTFEQIVEIEKTYKNDRFAEVFDLEYPPKQDILSQHVEDAQLRITQLSAKNEKINREWKLKNDMLWEQLIQHENKIRTLTSEKKQLERTVHEIVEQTTKESEKLCRELGHRALERFDWRAEMDVLRESLVKHHVCPADHYKPGFRMPLPTYVDDVIQTIVDSIQEIKKTEPIMNMFYCSFDDFECGEPVSNTMTYPGIETYAKVYLMTSTQVYELQGYFKGKPWLTIQPNNWDAHGIYLRSAIPQYEVKNLEYGTFYRFHPIAEVHTDVNWYAVSMLINGTKGNIGKAVNRTYVVHAQENYENSTPSDTRENASHMYSNEVSHTHRGVNLSSGSILKQTAERYITNVINAVTMAQ